MSVRKAQEEDLPDVVRLATKHGLDYGGMEADDFWVVEEAGRVVGICGLKRHPECLELCALGVEEAFRGRGWGEKLVWAVLGDAADTVYLATIIPGFFARLGFGKARSIPSSMVKKAEWCAGCRPELCTVMVRRGTK
jgi:N-acetylglutamate synthase-like GNAT family acetyltransferase